MNPWRPYPLLRMLFPFLAGIACEYLLESIFRIPLWPYWAGAVLLFLLVRFARKWIPYRFRWVPGTVIFVCLFCTGFTLTRPQIASTFTGFGDHPNEGCFLIEVVDQPVIRNNGVRAVVRIKGWLSKGRFHHRSGRAIVYFRGQGAMHSIRYGRTLLMKGEFRGISDNGNPYGFSYAGYMKSKGIMAQAYPAEHEYRVAGGTEDFHLVTAALTFRDRMLDIFRQNNLEGREFAVAAALLLGYVGGIDADLRKDYAATGAMHILSVSGMHVGIIYIFLEFILGFMERKRVLKVVKALLIIAFIWFYALVTGFSPSVLRASAMLSLIVAGKTLDRSPNILNILAASMLFILALDPMLMFDIGFQLSYLALAGIVLLYKPIYDLYVTSRWLPDKLWSMVAVSVAAQITTFPLSLYVFHQFPNYFMLTNIFVVPLSGLIIYLGIFVLLFGSLSSIGYWSAWLLGVLVWLLNQIIHRIEQLPFSTTTGVFFPLTVMVSLYLLIVIASMFLFSRKKRYFFALLILIILLASYGVFRKVSRLGTMRFVVYNEKRESLMEFRRQDRSVVLYGMNPARSPGEWGAWNRETVRTHGDATGVKHTRLFWLLGTGRNLSGRDTREILHKSGNFIRFGDCRVGIVGSPVPKNLERKIRVDYLVLTGSPRLKITDLQRVYQFSMILVDSSNPSWQAAAWAKEAAALGVKCHVVAVSGAFVRDF